MRALSSSLLPFVAVALTLASVAPAGATTTDTASPRFKLFVRESGVYAVTFEDLVAAGWTGEPVPSAALGLSRQGESVPIHVRGGGDGLFGPGDAVELVGTHLPGTRSWFAEETAWAVYWLALEGGGPRFELGSAVRRARRCPLAVERHLEEDRLLLRFSPRLGDIEPWMWSRLSMFPKDRLSLELELEDLDRRAKEPLQLEAQVRGWSTPRLPADVASHLVVASLEGAEVARLEFAGQESGSLTATLAPSDLTAARPTLELTAPQRLDEKGNPIVDISLLNWIKLRYPRDLSVTNAQSQVVSRRDKGCRSLSLEAPERERVTVFGARTRVEGPVSQGNLAFKLPVAEKSWWLVADGSFHRPAAIELDRPSDLRSRPRQADYVMITHSSLRLAIEPLAEIHRRRGLSVEVVHVDDVYDEFSYGIVDPAAIRDFLAFTQEQWPAPAPRFALLVGDASWDARNEELDDMSYADMTWAPFERRTFNKIPSTPHPRRPTLGHRNLIPTWRWASSDGHAAADNYFVDFDDDGLPEMAIGRLPVSEPDEIRGIVGKISRYLAGPPVGPWRRQVLWLANEQKGFQMQTDRLADAMAEFGFGGAKIYPQPEESNNEHHQADIREALDDGQLMVHFVGHGGRYIWRTGPPDPRKNHDLFTLDDLDELEPNEKLPVILSMTCYSAPFDHPTADSIGERFLRLPDRGAIAVFAASWRFSPAQRISERLMRALLEQPTMGEALLVTKRSGLGPGFTMMFNLLGDPALPMAAPPAELSPRLAAQSVELDLPAWGGAGSRVILEAFGEGGTVLAKAELAVAGPVSWELPETALAATRVAAYAWNEELGLDAAGVLEIIEPTVEPAVEPDAVASTEVVSSAATQEVR